MRLKHLRLLLSCHGWEDFPTHATGGDAENLLVSWTALWHPRLLTEAGSLPSWHRVDSPPEDCSGFLFLAPSLSAEQLPTGFQARVAEQEGRLVVASGQRADLTSELLTSVELNAESAGQTPPLAGEQMTSEQTDPFFALGFAYLQVQVLTRQYRYSSSLDEAQFQRLVVEAAKLAGHGTTAELNSAITRCFDLLTEERNRYFSNDIYLLDWSLTTNELVSRLPLQLNWPVPINLHLPASALPLLTAFSGQQPAAAKQNESASDRSDAATAGTATRLDDLLDRLRERIEANQICLVGGEQSELRNTLLSFRSLCLQLELGRQAFLSSLSHVPEIFGRQRFGMTPAHPELLHQFGYQGAIHATMDDGRFPTHPDNQVRWVGFSGVELPALTEPPLDAALGESFLKLPGQISQAIDRRHVAIVLFAHWAGHTSTWYHDLITTARFGSTLGRFVTLRELFDLESDTEHSQQWLADDYASPFHRQAIIANELNPVSRWREYWKSQALIGDSLSLMAMAQALGAPERETFELAAQIDSGHTNMDAASDAGSAEQYRHELDQLARQCRERVISRLTGSQKAESDSARGDSARGDSARGDSARGGYLLINPQSIPRREFAELPVASVTCQDENAIYAQETIGRERVEVVVDVPAHGFVYLTPDSKPAALDKKRLPLVEEGVVRNEFFQLTTDRQTGGLRSVMLYHERGNLLSQQLACRQADRRRSRSGRGSGQYTPMVADSVEVTRESLLRATMTSRGKLMDPNDRSTVAEFQQALTVTRGIRIFDLHFEIDVKNRMRADPWNEYLAARFAWSDEAAPLYRAVNDSRDLVTRKRIESPLFLEIAGGAHKVTLFMDGLPYHHRRGYRQIDCLLVPAGEKSTSFSMGAGVDVKNPLRMAYNRLAPLQPEWVESGGPPSASGWLYHFNCRNVVPVHWQVSSTVANNATEIWLKETDGRQGELKIRCPKPPEAARVLDLRGEPVRQCEVSDDQIKLTMHPHSFVRLVIEW